MKFNAFCALACGATVMLGASAANATVILDVGAGVVQPDENLLFNNAPAPGTTIEGWTNQTNTFVTIAGGEMLTAGGGQARVDTTDNLISSTFSFHGLSNQLVGFDLSDPGVAFAQTEFRIFGGTATELTMTFVDTAGEVFSETFAIPANGFFNASVVDGQPIDYFSLSANGTIGDVRQVRLGGIIDFIAIPEPATWAMMIVGFGGVGGLMRRRRAGLLARG